MLGGMEHLFYLGLYRELMSLIGTPGSPQFEGSKSCREIFQD